MNVTTDNPPAPGASAPADTDVVNIASYLPKMAAKQPDTLAVAFPRDARPVAQRHYLRWSYRQLNDESDIIARGLQSIGITRGMRTVLMVTPGPEFFALVFALFKIGAVLVAVDPGMGIRNLKTCLAEAQPEAFIGIRKAHIARKLFGWARGSNRINVLVGRRLLQFGGTIALSKVRRLGLAAPGTGNGCELPVATTRDETAAVLFTSGSTGVPKGAVYTHGNFDAQVRALIELFDIRPGEVDLCTFPLFALYAPAMGMTAIVPRMDFTRPGKVDRNEIYKPIRRFSVTNLFGSPALLGVIASYKTGHDPRYYFPSLRRVISAGAPVPSDTIARVAPLLSSGRQVFTPYGATESLPVCSIGSDEILGETAALTRQGRGVCVGRPAAGIEGKIIRIFDHPIPDWSPDLELPSGQIGEICVRGPQVTRSYFNRDASTKLAKIACADGTFFHRMGDLGYFDEKGRIWYCGRKSERVVTIDKTYYTANCEEIFNHCGSCARTALVGVRLQGVVTPVICWEDLDAGRQTLDFANLSDDEVRSELQRLAEAHEASLGITHFIFFGRCFGLGSRIGEFRRRPLFPTDIRHNSKINRPLLAKWAAKRLGGEPA